MNRFTSEGGDTLYVMDQLSDKKNREDKLGAGFLPSRTQSAVSASGSGHIINLRFFEGKTQMEVAEEIGISQAQVSRLEKSAPQNHEKLSVLKHPAAGNRLLSAPCFPAAALFQIIIEKVLLQDSGGIRILFKRESFRIMLLKHLPDMRVHRKRFQIMERKQTDTIGNHLSDAAECQEFFLRFQDRQF